MSLAIRLEWDSAFFGIPVGRVLGPHLDPDAAARVEAWARDSEIRVIYLEVGADDRASIRTAEQYGYQLVDVRVVLERRSGAAESGSLRLAHQSDLPILEEIARDGFSDSRYYFDEGFDREACSRLYRTWVRESTRGFADAVLVAERDGQVSGFVTCHAESGAARIGLIGVSDRHQGQGVGSDLVHGAVDWARGQGLPGVRVATQGRNIGAQRLYQKCGFRTESVRLYYHRWFEGESR